MKRIAVVVTRGPDHALGMREMLDMALVFAAFERDVSIIFQDEGVLWTELPQRPKGYPTSITGKLKSLSIHDINEIIIHKESLNKFPFVIPRLRATVETTYNINLRYRDTDIILEA